MIKHFGRDHYRERAWTMAFYWARRPVRERLDGQSYWRGEFVITIEPPRRVDQFWAGNQIDARLWTGRPRSIAWFPGYISIKIRSPGGFLWSYWR